MFCKVCGKEIPNGARFCPDCGKDQQEALRPTSISGMERPSSYLVLSILVTMFCCVLFGAIGIVYASKVDSCWNAGYYDDARKFSRKARNWSLAGLFGTILLWLLYIVALALTVGLASGMVWPWDLGESWSI